MFAQNTVKSESIHSVGSRFSAIFPSNLGQISKSGFDGEIEENPDSTEWIDSDFTVVG